jgi:putative peptidoglycan lipid II flippase
MKVSIAIIILNLIGKVIGFFRDILFASHFGRSYINDAFQFATNIPNLIFSSILAAVGTFFIPQYIKMLGISKKRADAYFLQTVITLGIFLTVIATIFLSGKEFIVEILAPGFDVRTNRLAVDLISYFFVLGIFSVIFGIFNLYFNALRKFYTPLILTIIMSFLNYLWLLLFIDNQGVYSSVYGSIFSTCILLILYVYFIVNSNLQMSINIKSLSWNAKDLIVRLFPLLISNLFLQLGSLVDSIMASKFGEGGISALNYAFKINNLILTIFVYSIVTKFFTDFSESYLDENSEALAFQVSESLKALLLILIPITIIIIFLSQDLVSVIYQRGAFTKKDAYITSLILNMFVIGLISFGIRDVLNKVFYSLNLTYTAIYYGFVAVALNIVFNVIISRFLGVMGIALATSLASIITMLLMLRRLYSKLPTLNLSIVIRNFFAILFCSLLPSFILMINTTDTNKINNILIIAIKCVLYLIFYLVLITNINLVESKIIIKKFKKKIGVRK